MKKIIISLLVVVLCCTTVKADDSIQTINKAKAIVAYEMNMLSFESGKKNEAEIEKLKKIEKKESIEAIKNAIDETFSANRELCDDIDKLNYLADTGKSLSIYFSQTIFEEDFLKKFIKGKGEKAVKIKKCNIKEKIIYLEKQLEETVKNNNEKQSVVPEGMQHSGYIPNRFEDQPSIMLGLLILAIIGYVLSAYLFFKDRKKTARIMRLKDKLRTANDQNERFNKDQIELTIRLEKAEDKQKGLLSINRELTEELDQRKMVEAREEEAKAKIKAEAAKWPKVIFLATPSKEGLFSEEFSEYKKGRALYRLTTDDGKIGRFEFIDERETLTSALNSVSSFLKPACDIDEVVSARDTVNIITISNGIAKKTDDGWEVSTKAKIQFS